MAFDMVLLCVLLAAATPPVAAQAGVAEGLLLAAEQRPWLWGVFVFTVGLPVILFISFMWPDVRFGPPDQQYYHFKKSDDVQPDDPDSSPHTLTQPTNGGANTAGARRRDIQGDQKKSDLDLKVQ